MGVGIELEDEGGIVLRDRNRPSEVSRESPLLASKDFDQERSIFVIVRQEQLHFAEREWGECAWGGFVDPAYDARPQIC